MTERRAVLLTDLERKGLREWAQGRVDSAGKYADPSWQRLADKLAHDASDPIAKEREKAETEIQELREEVDLAEEAVAKIADERNAAETRVEEERERWEAEVRERLTIDVAEELHRAYAEGGQGSFNEVVDAIFDKGEEP